MLCTAAECVCVRAGAVCAVCVFLYRNSCVLSLSPSIISYCLLIYWFLCYAIVRVSVCLRGICVLYPIYFGRGCTRLLLHISKPIKLIETIRAHIDYYCGSKTKQRKNGASEHACGCAKNASSQNIRTQKRKKMLKNTKTKRQQAYQT